MASLVWTDWTGLDRMGWANIARLLWSVQKMLLDKLVSNMHYYSHLAATLHILRDNARELFSHWIRKYGSDSARKYHPGLLAAVAQDKLRKTIC